MAKENLKRRALILPVLKLEKDKSVVVIVEDKMRKSDVKLKDGSEPAYIATVTNADTGEQSILICAAVIRSTLEREYPNAGYVGKRFEITKGDSRKGGKTGSYNTYRMFELQ